MSRFSVFVGVACAVAATLAAEPQTEAPVAHLSEVQPEEAKPVFMAVEAENVMLVLPSSAAPGESEANAVSNPQKPEEKEEDEEEGAEKRELCHGNKCVKVKPRKGKLYKLKKKRHHHKKARKVIVPYREGTLKPPAPQKEAEPIPQKETAPLPQKQASPFPVKRAAPLPLKRPAFSLPQKQTAARSVPQNQQAADPLFLERRPAPVYISVASKKDAAEAAGTRGAPQQQYIMDNTNLLQHLITYPDESVSVETARRNFG